MSERMVGYGRGLRRELRMTARTEDAGSCCLLAEDVRALLAHEDRRAGEAAEDGDGVVGVAQEEPALL